MKVTATVGRTALQSQTITVEVPDGSDEGDIDNALVAAAADSTDWKTYESDYHVDYATLSVDEE